MQKSRIAAVNDASLTKDGYCMVDSIVPLVTQFSSCKSLVSRPRRYLAMRNQLFRPWLSLKSAQRAADRNWRLIDQQPIQADVLTVSGTAQSRLAFECSCWPEAVA